MKPALIAISLGLAVLAAVGKQCNAAAGSVALVLLKGGKSGCADNPSDITQAPYTGLVELLKTAEGELSLTRSALGSKSVDDSCSACTQEIIDETITTTISNKVTPLIREALTRVYTLNGWTAAGNYVFKTFKERADYATATQRCMDLGGRLATEVLRHRDAVKHIIDEKYSTAQWIGFDDIKSEGSWNWIDGGSMNPETTAWNTGEPNGGKNENCGQIWSYSATKILLNDSICSYKYQYICEIKAV